MYPNFHSEYPEKKYHGFQKIWSNTVLTLKVIRHFSYEADYSNILKWFLKDHVSYLIYNSYAYEFLWDHVVFVAVSVFVTEEQ